MEVLEINDNDLEKILKENQKVLLDCYAPWCGPCRMLSPIIEELALKYQDIKFLKVNVDANEEISKKYGIMSIPTLLLFQNGELKEQFIGLKSKSELSSILDNWK